MVDAGGFSRSNGVVSDNGGTIKHSSWSDAISYCEILSLDSKNDWRLPNLNELTSLVDYTKFNPSLDVIFQNPNSNGYWSSTSPSNNNVTAWIVYFYYGTQTNSSKDTSNSVRCVRAGQ
jgi:hypothetical protein